MIKWVLVFQIFVDATKRIKSRHRRPAANGDSLPGFLKTSNV